ncbi:hypothetical protein [Halomonas cupida]|uniref:hypothetical protein n=1 Tax=Halomonas cupida TaxID=44933 RepID=UPI003A9556AF
MTTLKAPSRFKNEARRLWISLVTEHGLEGHTELLILDTAVECFERMREAQKLIREQGVSVPHGESVKQNPACLVEKDSRKGMLDALKALDLTLDDAELPVQMGRPPRSR